MKVITESDYKVSLAEAYKKFGFAYKRLAPYEYAQRKIKFKCEDHGLFDKYPGDLLKGHGCPKCSAERRSRARHKATEIKFKASLKATFPKLQLVSSGSLRGKKQFRCFECNYQFCILPKTALSKGCPACSGLWRNAPPKSGPRLTSEDFLRELEKTPFRLLSPFKGKVKKHKFQCTKHGCVVVTTGSSILKHKLHCLECRKETPSKKLLTREVWEDRIKESHGDSIRLLGAYRGTGDSQKYRFKCYKCFTTWKTQLPSVARGGGCPRCARQKVHGFQVKEFNLHGQTLRLQGYEYQAVLWILENSKVKLKDILFESSGKVPVIQYKFGRRWRRYYPDMFLPKTNRIIEVKSVFTAGLGGKGPGTSFRQVQAKARACIEEGYSYSLLLMSGKGTRFHLPPNWYLMSKIEVLGWCAYQRGDLVKGKVRPPTPLNSPYKGDKHGRVQNGTA